MTKLNRIVSLGLATACALSLVGCLNDIEQSQPNNNGDNTLLQGHIFPRHNIAILFHTNPLQNQSLFPSYLSVLSHPFF